VPSGGLDRFRARFVERINSLDEEGFLGRDFWGKSFWGR